MINSKYRRGVSFLRLAVLCLTAAVAFHTGLWMGSLHSESGAFDIRRSVLEMDFRSSQPNAGKSKVTYESSPLETYFVQNAAELGFDKESPMPRACDPWLKDSSAVKGKLHKFRKELNEYSQRVKAFRSPISDLRPFLTGHHKNVCDSLELHPRGLPGIFSSGALSKSSHGGYMEPLFSPFRDPEICFANGTEIEGYLLSLKYLVHDYARFCRRLKPSSKIVFVDMGASLDFHEQSGQYYQPSMDIIEVFQRFGFVFDHIYAYEVNVSAPYDVFKQVPDDILPAYHWMNVGVDPSPSSKMNPWRMILEAYEPDDFIIVKVDIDDADTELAFAHQLLHTKKLSKLVDVFYFEHHVFIEEMATSWLDSMHGTVQESMKLFSDLRKAGVAAHYWV